MNGWQFDETGAFTLQDPLRTSYLYFPLVNEAGLMASVTPLLNGDLKTDQNHFLLAPVSVEDLHNSRSARNFWVFVKGQGAFSATGNSARQVASRFDNAERVTLHAGFLWHKLIRHGGEFGLRAEVTNLIPPGDDQVELMQVTLTNVSPEPISLTPTSAIPIFGRSADNLRDHRHVTSLLHRITTHRYGVLMRPTLSFDERGHQLNTTTYAVLGVEQDGTAPQSFCPLVHEFIGEGGCLEAPRGILKQSHEYYPAGCQFAGSEAIGALRFQTILLEPGQSRSYILILAVMPEGVEPGALVKKYGSRVKFDEWFRRNQAHWQAKLETLAFHTGDRELDHWLNWVSLQPILRRLFGNSFLPYHDYGRGGRGWRDLWQDCLALLMMEPIQVPELLFGNFAGVRIDGSNATIIGSRPGEFLADRNNITRIWMDHGAWPLLTTELYLDQSGDLDFLLREQTYFKDRHVERARGIDEAWHPEQGTLLRTASGDVYRGTVLEHLLVQHLTPFFNVGEHNNIKLEGADWNDALDMASARGESVAFTALYASNLSALSRLVCDLAARGVTHLALPSELMPLLDTLNEPVNYDSVAEKHKRLGNYFASVRHTLSGQQARVDCGDLARDLAAKANWLCEHLRTQEWISNREGYGWFNGYYDNDGARVEGDHPNGVRMTLTGQVFTLRGGVATDVQARELVRAADHYLLDPKIGGYRLNTDFGEVRLNLGRCFGFAFGTKENGAMFSHMAVMYANALYSRGLVREGFKVLNGIYQHCRDFSVSRIYPGIPEYFDGKGRGAYPYLTGSASWLLLTWLNEVLGIKGRRGDLVLEPKLVCEQFGAGGQCGVETQFAGHKLHVVYDNTSNLDYGAYRIQSILMDGERVPFTREGDAAILSRGTIAALAGRPTHRVDVTLGRK